MKIKYVFSVLMICLLQLSTNLMASSPESSKSGNKIEYIEDNLLEGLSSDNLGLRISTAYYLGEYKSERALVPLIKMLHNEKEESARIQAALSLIKIGDPKGAFMVKQAARFDESTKVRNFCTKFYNAFKERLINQ
jgi:HEAT repeat protein